MKTIRILLLAIVAGLMVVACSNREEAVKVAEKIQKGETLTQGDYTCMIEYLGKFAEAAQPIQDNINNLPYGDSKAAEYQKELDDLKAKNEYLTLFNNELAKTPQATLGAENVQLVDKYAGYEWFTAPDWANIETDPEAAGIEVQTPPTDTTGVVAGAVDEVKVVDE